MVGTSASLAASSAGAAVAVFSLMGVVALAGFGLAGFALAGVVLVGVGLSCITLGGATLGISFVWLAVVLGAAGLGVGISGTAGAVVQAGALTCGGEAKPAAPEQPANLATPEHGLATPGALLRCARRAAAGSSFSTRVRTTTSVGTSVACTKPVSASRT